MKLLRPSRILLALALAAAPALSQAPGPSPDAASSPGYSRAQQAFAARRYREAAGLFAAVATAESAHPPEQRSDALLMQAKSLVNLNDFTAADAALQRFLQQDARSAQALYLLGYVLQRENKPRESLETFTRAAAIKPPLPNDLKLVALDYVLLDDYPDAIHWLDRSLEADPRNEEAWYDLGRAHMHQGNFINAESSFRRALALNPQDPKALDNLGLSLEAQNRTDDALSAYKQAVEAQAGAPRPGEQPFLDFGALLNTRNRASEAIEPLRRAVEIAPSSSRCREELARAYTATGQHTLARQQMEQAVALDPRNPRLHYQLGQLYRHAGLADRAQQELKRSSELYGTHSASPEP